MNEPKEIIINKGDIEDIVRTFDKGYQCDRVIIYPKKYLKTDTKYILESYYKQVISKKNKQIKRLKEQLTNDKRKTLR